MPHISELFIYPLKSAKGLSLKQVALSQKGPEFDRHWMVINKKNRFITQRQQPKMCLINTTLKDKKLTLEAPKMPSLVVLTSEQRIQVTVWQDTVQAADCGEAAAQWISNYLGIDGCRLVYMPNETQRHVDTDYATEQQTVSFADGFPSLIISQASLDDFNSKLESPIPMTNFRPNIVISDCSAYAEDEWKEIRIGGITFSLVKPCSRCIMPSIDQETADKQPAVLDALNKYRRRERATYFGQNALHDKPGLISVGDEIDIIR